MQTFLQGVEAIGNFMNNERKLCDIVVIMGKSKGKGRDFAIFANNNGRDDLVDAIVEALKRGGIVLPSHTMQGDSKHFYKELGKESNRKTIIPIIESIIDTFQ